MGLRCLYLAITLLPALATGPQQGQQREEQTPQRSEQQEEQPKRPRLGPAPAPSLYGVRSSNIMDARKLTRVGKIYVERMDNALSEKIMEGLAKSRRFRVVASRNEADAVLRGTCISLRRMKVVHSEVYLNDVNGASIWQDNVRRPYNPPALEAAVGETATLVVTHLRDDAAGTER